MTTPFRQFQAFHAVIESGTVTAAAEHLGISQPAISNLLSQLERQTTLKLFERRRGRLVPTPEAKALFDEVDTVVRGLDHVNQTVVDLQNQKAGQLQVAASHALAFGFMPAEIAAFGRDRPNLTLAFQSQYSGRIQEWVAAGLFEIGICELPVRHEALDQRHFTFETVCAIPRRDAPEGHGPMTPALLNDYPFITMQALDFIVRSGRALYAGISSYNSRRTREAFHSDGANFRIRCHTDLFRNALNLVKQGMGAAMIDPFTLASDDGQGYVVRRFEPTIFLDIVILTRRDRPLSVIGRQFLDQIIPRMEQTAVGA